MMEDAGYLKKAVVPLKRINILVTAFHHELSAETLCLVIKLFLCHCIQLRDIEEKLEIRQVGEGMQHVPGLVEASVKNMSEVWEILHTGSKTRAVG
ncbi:kinesin-like protein KIN-14E [Apium graveolens]|uniref:kinesin-like protein KIN-14E n=1 Tax=Apium graveolens TaxID=4045 RepID=UPI003D79B721